MSGETRADGPEGESTADRLEGEFPGWHVWVSGAGRFWAVRQGPGAEFSRADPRPMTVDADDEDAMREQLAGYREAA